jgi:hypothetical protein
VGALAVIGEAVRPALAAAAMGVVVAGLRSMNLFLIPLVGGVVYVGMLFATRVFSRDELRVLRGVYVSFGLPGSALLTRARNQS